MPSFSRRRASQDRRRSQVKNESIYEMEAPTAPVKPQLRHCPNCANYATFGPLPTVGLAGLSCCGECGWIEGATKKEEPDPAAAARRLRLWSQPQSLEPPPSRAVRAMPPLPSTPSSGGVRLSAVQRHRTMMLDQQRSESEKLVRALSARGVRVGEATVQRALCAPRDRTAQECARSLPALDGELHAAREQQFDRKLHTAIHLGTFADASSVEAALATTVAVGSGSLRVQFQSISREHLRDYERSYEASLEPTPRRGPPPRTPRRRRALPTAHFHRRA